MAKSMKVPKGWEDSFAALTALTDLFCDEHLTAEYAELARYGVDGFIVDARGLPVEMQDTAVAKGMIPFVYKQPG